MWQWVLDVAHPCPRALPIYPLLSPFLRSVQLMVFVPLVYLCACTYYSLFKLGIFSFYYLVPGHTDSVSLLMNCS